VKYVIAGLSIIASAVITVATAGAGFGVAALAQGLAQSMVTSLTAMGVSAIIPGDVGKIIGTALGCVTGNIAAGAVGGIAKGGATAIGEGITSGLVSGLKALPSAALRSTLVVSIKDPLLGATLGAIAGGLADGVVNDGLGSLINPTSLLNAGLQGAKAATTVVAQQRLAPLVGIHAATAVGNVVGSAVASTIASGIDGELKLPEIKSMAMEFVTQNAAANIGSMIGRAIPGPIGTVFGDAVGASLLSSLQYGVMVIRIEDSIRETMRQRQHDDDESKSPLDSSHGNAATTRTPAAIPSAKSAPSKTPSTVPAKASGKASSAATGGPPSKKSTKEKPKVVEYDESIAIATVANRLTLYGSPSGASATDGQFTVWPDGRQLIAEMTTGSPDDSSSSSWSRARELAISVLEFGVDFTVLGEVRSLVELVTGKDIVCSSDHPTFDLQYYFIFVWMYVAYR
jgi:hypothetical protein